MSYSLFAVQSEAPAGWRSWSLRPGGETWPGSAEPGPSGCSTEPGPGCEGEGEGDQGLACPPGRGWPGGSLQPTGDRRAAGPGEGTDPPGNTRIRRGEIQIFKLTCGGPGTFSDPGKGIFIGLRKTEFIGICWWELDRSRGRRTPLGTPPC